MSHETSVQPSLADLMARYLEKQADAQAVGIATFDGEVTPYEVGPVQPLDPKLAWDEALAVLAFYGPTHVQRRQAPPHWSHLVANHESIVAVAFSAANWAWGGYQRSRTYPSCVPSSAGPLLRAS
jgi:hypothetical protein